MKLRKSPLQKICDIFFKFLLSQEGSSPKRASGILVYIFRDYYKNHPSYLTIIQEYRFENRRIIYITA